MLRPPEATKHGKLRSGCPPETAHVGPVPRKWKKTPLHIQHLIPEENDSIIPYSSSLNSSQNDFDLNFFRKIYIRDCKPGATNSASSGYAWIPQIRLLGNSALQRYKQFQRRRSDEVKELSVLWIESSEHRQNWQWGAVTCLRSLDGMEKSHWLTMRLQNASKNVLEKYAS